MDSSSMARALSPSRSCLSLGSSDMSSGELSTDSDCSSQHGEVFCNTGKVCLWCCFLAVVCSADTDLSGRELMA